MTELCHRHDFRWYLVPIYYTATTIGIIFGYGFCCCQSTNTISIVCTNFPFTCQNLEIFPHGMNFILANLCPSKQIELACRLFFPEANRTKSTTLVKNIVFVGYAVVWLDYITQSKRSTVPIRTLRSSHNISIHGNVVLPSSSEFIVNHSIRMICFYFVSLNSMEFRR